MVYAVFDTNVLVSALLSKSADSTISLVIKHFLEGDYTVRKGKTFIEQ